MKLIQSNYFLPVVAITFALVFGGIAVATGAVTFQTGTKDNSYEYYSFFSATTTNATSTNIAGGGGYFVIAGAKNVELYFTHGGVGTTSTGTSTFAVQVSPDGTNWYDYAKLVTGTSSTPIPYIDIKGATSTVYANISTILTDAFYAIRCIVTEGTAGGAFVQGEHTCAAAAIF